MGRIKNLSDIYQNSKRMFVNLIIYIPPKNHDSSSTELAVHTNLVKKKGSELETLMRLLTQLNPLYINIISLLLTLM